MGGNGAVGVAMSAVRAGLLVAAMHGVVLSHAHQSGGLAIVSGLLCAAYVSLGTKR